jgi:hypothetical protein
MSLTFILDDEALEQGRTRISNACVDKKLSGTLEWETNVNTVLSEISETLSVYVMCGYTFIRVTAEYRKDR